MTFHEVIVAQITLREITIDEFTVDKFPIFQSLFCIIDARKYFAFVDGGFVRFAHENMDFSIFSKVPNDCFVYKFFRMMNWDSTKVKAFKTITKYSVAL